MNVFSLHIEPLPPPPAIPSILRINGYFIHLEADNLFIKQSELKFLGRSCFSLLLAGILMCSQDAKTCYAGIVMTTIDALKKITSSFVLLLD